jgi:exosortase
MSIFQTAFDSEGTKPTKRTLVLSVLILGVLAANFGLVGALVGHALSAESASHILIVPLVTLVLLFRRRAEVYSAARWDLWYGGGLTALGAAFRVTAPIIGFAPESAALTLGTLSLLTMLWGAFLCCFGRRSACAVMFPLGFLLLCVPIPAPMLESVMGFLIAGSAWATGQLFRLTGTPFIADGAAFRLPRITIELARQCSGIRSSMALFITSLLMAHFSLERWWTRGILVFIAVPLAILKNAVRIVSLSLLAIYVDPQWLMGSDLHRRGGVVFFVFTLLIMMLALGLLRWCERAVSPTALHVTHENDPYL